MKGEAVVHSKLLKLEDCRRASKGKTLGQAKPTDPSPEHVLNMHRTIGNQAVQRLFEAGRDIVGVYGRYAPQLDNAKSAPARDCGHAIRQAADPYSLPLVQQQKTERIPGAFFPTVRSAVGDSTVAEALSRKSNPLIRRAYSSEVPWFFSPNKGLAGWTSKDDILESARTRHRVGNAAAWMKTSMVRAMPDLGSDLEHFPSGEGVVWWGSGVYTCNVFVFDVLYSVGLNPPLMGNAHYYDPIRLYNLSGDMGSYFSDLSVENIQPGDVFATTGHMEIITSASSETEVRRGRRSVTVRTFSSIGAGKNGVGVEESTGVAATRKVFRRVGSGAIESSVAVT